MSKPKAKHEFTDPMIARGKVFSVRFLIVILLVAVGIAWVVLWTLYVRDERTMLAPKQPDTLIPSMEKLKDWNWLVGFGLILVGLAFSAHPSTPLGRGTGVIVGMLGCFLIGLIWICTFYVFADKPEGEIWLIGDLGQFNLMVGIGFMAVGFSFATKWE